MNSSSVHNSAIVFLINDDVRAVKACYEDHAAPDVFKTMDTNIKVDDILVVQSGTRHELTIVKVTEVDVEPDLHTTKPIKWVVSKVETSDLKTMLAEEGNAILTVQKAERQRKKDELRQTMFGGHTDDINTLKLANLGSEDLTE